MSNQVKRSSAIIELGVPAIIGLSTGIYIEDMLASLIIGLIILTLWIVVAKTIGFYQDG